VPFTNLAPANTAATDPDFNTYMVMVTDTTVQGQTFVYQVGDGVFNRNNTLFLAENTGGGVWVYQVNPSLIHSQGCSPSTPCVTQSQIRGGATDSTHLVNGGSWIFSRVPGETNVLYELAANGTLVYKTAINTSGAPSTWTVTRAPYVDFTKSIATGGPVDCSVIPTSYSHSWSGSWSVANDGSINVGSTGGPDWQASWTPTVTETFILPTVGNSAKKGFQATAVTGPTSGTEPTWSSCSTACTDGGVTWTNVGAVNAQGKGFDVFSYQPGVGCSYVNTLIGKIYRGTGNAQPAGYWTTDDDVTCARLGQSPPCSIGDTMQLHETRQMYDPAYALIGAAGGGGSTACIVPGTCSCAESNSNYLGAWSSATTYAIHDLVFYNTVWYQSKTAHQNSSTPDTDTTDWKVDDVYCYGYLWQKNSTTIRPCIELGVGGRNSCDSHRADGYDSFYAGGKYFSHYYSKPVIGGFPNPGVASIPTALPADRHISRNNVTPGDRQPMMMFGTDVPTATANYAAAGYSEDAAVLTDGSQTMYRFLHNYNTGSSSFFAVQNAVGDVSQDGTLAAVTTDMMGTRGSASSDWAGAHTYVLGDMIFPTAGNTAGVEFQVTAVTGPSSGTEPTWSACTSTCTDGGVTWTNTTKSCNNLRAYFVPAASTYFNSGDTILPINTSGNAQGAIFQAQNSGTSGPVPNWTASCPNYGDTCSDTVITWKNIGPNTCRGDIVIMDLLSAHAPP
jgi:hypothetical protein